MLTGRLKRNAKWDGAASHWRWAVLVLVLMTSIVWNDPALTETSSSELPCSEQLKLQIADDITQSDPGNTCCRPIGACSFGMPAAPAAVIIGPIAATWAFHRTEFRLPKLTYSYFRPPRLQAFA